MHYTVLFSHLARDALFVFSLLGTSRFPTGYGSMKFLHSLLRGTAKGNHPEGVNTVAAAQSHKFRKEGKLILFKLQSCESWQEKLYLNDRRIARGVFSFLGPSVSCCAQPQQPCPSRQYLDSAVALAFSSKNHAAMFSRYPSLRVCRLKKCSCRTGSLPVLLAQFSLFLCP